MTNKNNKNLIIIIVAVVAVFILAWIFGFSSYGMMSGYRTYGMMGGYGYGFSPFGWIFSVLIIVLVIAGIYWFIKNTKR